MAKWKVEEKRTMTTTTKREDGEEGERQGD